MRFMIILFYFFSEKETGDKITSGHHLKDFVIMTTFILKETLQFLRIKKKQRNFWKEASQLDHFKESVFVSKPCFQTFSFQIKVFKY